MKVLKADKPCVSCGLVKWFGVPHPWAGKRTPPMTRLCTGRKLSAVVEVNDMLLKGWEKSALTKG